jgi:hypothetical protein
MLTVLKTRVGLAQSVKRIPGISAPVAGSTVLKSAILVTLRRAVIALSRCLSEKKQLAEALPRLGVKLA